MDVEIALLSQPGGREHNEDTAGHWEDARYLACVLSDGAGGHGGGDVAAGIVRSSVLEGFAAAPRLGADGLRGLLEEANRAVVRGQAEGGAQSGMRATVVLAAVDRASGELAWAHSGDSRAYLFRHGALLARTVDHSLVQQMVASGLLDEEAARCHPQRNMLLSALGSLEEPPEIAVAPPVPLAAGDVLLLCSDGLWEPLGDAGLQAALQLSRSPAQWVQELDARVRARGLPRQDNYTALVAWVHDDDATRLMPPAPEA